jgi:hypothetical protein
MGISPVDDLLWEADILHEERPEKIEIERWAQLAKLLA